MAFPVDDQGKVEELILERVQMYLTTMAPQPIYLQGAKARVQELAYTSDQLAYTISGWMLGNKFPDRSEYEHVEYPDGPWEALKERYAPKWLLARWPLKNKSVRVESARYHYNICPHWNARMDNSGRMAHIAFMAERPELHRKGF